MAINKVVNKSTKSHGALRNVLEYVLRDEKVKEGYVELAGPFSGEIINYDEIYQSWVAEKKLWNKDSGRMYTHNIISFHKDEQVTPDQVLEIGKAFAEKFFSGHQYIAAVHQDKDHLHCHIVVNSVSYLDGMKLHQTKKDLERQKEFTNSLCIERGLTVSEKGRHFDGSVMEQGEITAWGKDKYNLLANDSRKSFVAECAMALMDTLPRSYCREDFVSGMKERGWIVFWQDSRKHIVFQDEKGNKVRDTNLEKTFSLNVTKEALSREFERQNEERDAGSRTGHDRDGSDSLSRYYAEVETSLAGTGTDRTAVGGDPDTAGRNGGSEDRERGEDTGTFIRKLRSQERASAEKRNNRIAERSDRDAEHERHRIEAERRAQVGKRYSRERKARNRELRGSYDLSR